MKSDFFIVKICSSSLSIYFYSFQPQPKKPLFLEYASFILTSLYEMFFPVSLMRELFSKPLQSLNISTLSHSSP